MKSSSDARFFGFGCVWGLNFNPTNQTGETTNQRLKFNPTNEGWFSGWY